MAVYKIFPTKDASIYSEFPLKNTGLDEILESSVGLDISGTPQVSRFLVQFSTNEINDIITNKISGSNWQANFRGFLSYLEGLNSTTTLEFYPISGSWNMGTGKYSYSPEYTNGCSWEFRTASGSNIWVDPITPFTTASFPITNKGGGNWFTGSANATVLPIFSTQSFSYSDSSDINVGITNMVKAWYSGTIANEGLIVKQSEEFINSNNYQIEMKFFSIDTHTIYPPQLEFKWVDFIFNTGSSTNEILDIQPSTISISENPGVFYPGSINKFRINSRPTYPPRTFQTSSIYTTNYYLPTSSYYAIKDLDTNEFVIDFDTTYTQLSADEISSYFTLYMNGLEPERYYSILIKTIIDGSTIIFDDNYYFKIVNG